ncbi:MAG: class I adenylate-forming enzyme family protein, partial [Motiliproteus sp.]
MMNSISYMPPAETVRATIDFYASKQPELVFSQFPETGVKVTYAGLQQSAQSYSRYFKALGLCKGDTVSFMMGNGKAALELFLGTLYSGCISSPLNPAAGKDQIEYVLDHSDTKIVFVSEQYKEQVANAAEKLDRKVWIISTDADTGPEWPLDPADEEDILTINGSDDGLLMYTSGTTGRPKGVILTNKNLLAGGINTACAHELSAADRTLCVLPL